MKISIQKPCHENWNNMLPEEKGRFCLTCQKTVIDFTNKSKEEIKDFFQHSSTNICGRFRSSQLEPQLIQMKPIKRNHFFFMALYFVFGGLLFGSCGDHPTIGETQQGKIQLKNEQQKSQTEQNHKKDTLSPVVGKVKAKNECTKKNYSEPILDTFEMREVPILGDVNFEN